MVHHRQSTTYALWFWATFSLFVLAGAYLPLRVVESPLFFGPVVLLQLFFLFAWYKKDAAEHGIVTSRALDSAVIALAVIALPYYKFRYFGAAKAFLFLAKFVLALLLCLSALSILVLTIDMAVYSET